MNCLKKYIKIDKIKLRQELKKCCKLEKMAKDINRNAIKQSRHPKNCSTSYWNDIIRLSKVQKNIRQKMTVVKNNTKMKAEKSKMLRKLRKLQKRIKLQNRIKQKRNRKIM